MKILCAKSKMNEYSLLNCFNSNNSKQKNNIQPYIVKLTSNDLDGETLYKVVCNFKTQMGFYIPNNVYVLECNYHTFGLIGFNEIPIKIPIYNNTNNNIEKTIFIGVPVHILVPLEFE